MSNSKNAVNEIKKLMMQFGFLDEKTNKSFKLKDNTIVEAEDLKVGKKITKIDENFESVKLDNGNYKIENFEVSVKNGVITHVKEMFLEAKLVDGTQIKVEGESLMEGAKVVVVTEEGEIPAPDGIHLLEGGIKVQTAGGIIADIEEPEMIEEDMEEKKEEIIEEVKEVKEEDKDKEMIELLKKLMEKVQEKMKDMEEKMSKMEENFNAFKKEPASKPIPNGKTEFSKYNDAEDKRVSAILALRNNR